MRLYVGNIRWRVTDEELRQFFARVGQVTDAHIMRDPFTGKSRGFGFIEMPNEQEAVLAIERLNGAEFCGLALRVSHARPRGRNWFTGAEHGK